MMVAWLLAVVTLFIRQNGIEDPLDFAYAYRDPFTGTAFLPTNMAPMPVLEPSRKYVTHLWLHRKVRNVFEMLSNLAAICGLAGTTFPHPDQLGMFKMEWERMIEGNLTVSNGFGSGSFPTSTTFGVRRNGLALVSDFIMKPTMRLSSMLLYHIQHGQLLDLPVISEHVDSGTPVRSRGFTPKSSDINITSESDVWPPPEPVNWLRWDAEPCWEADVRTCCFNYRIGGIEQFQLGIHELSNGLRTSGLNTVVCGNHEDHEGSQDHWGLMFNPSLRTVGPDSTERHAQITRAKKWRQLPLVDMLRQGHLDVADVEGDDFPKSCHWLVQVGESEMLAMLALVSRFGHAVRPDVRFVTNCMVAGLDKAKQLGYPEKDVMMIVRSRNSTK